MITSEGDMWSKRRLLTIQQILKALKFHLSRNTYGLSGKVKASPGPATNCWDLDTTGPATKSTRTTDAAAPKGINYSFDSTADQRTTDIVLT
jgi:hypothetical protein